MNERHINPLDLRLERRAVLAAVPAAAMAGVLWPAQAHADVVEMKSDKRIRAGRYFSFGRDLKEPLRKFATVHKYRTGLDVSDHIQSVLDLFDPQTTPYDSSAGFCNGFTSREATQPDYQCPGVQNVGGVPITIPDLDAVFAVLHGDDGWVTEHLDNGMAVGFGERSLPRFQLQMLQEYMGKQRVPLGIDESRRPDQMWSRPIDEAHIISTPIGGGRFKYVVTVRAARYIENLGSGGATHESITREWYLNPDDPNDMGTGATFGSMFRPSFNFDQVIASMDKPRWTLEEGKVWGNYAIKTVGQAGSGFDPVMNREMINTALMLAGFVSW